LDGVHGLGEIAVGREEERHVVAVEQSALQKKDRDERVHALLAPRPSRAFPPSETNLEPVRSTQHVVE